MAFNEYYIAPTTGNDTTGDGSKSTPWATLQKALDTVTARSGGSPDRFNMKAGEEDSTSATLDFATYGSPTSAAFMVVQGYTTDEGDGGIGDLSGGGSATIISENAKDNIWFRDMKLHNSGANSIVVGDDYWGFVNCEITNNTSGEAVTVDNGCVFINNHIHNGGGIQVGAGCFVAFNYFETGANTPTKAHVIFGDTFIGSFVYRNLFRVGSGNEDAIRLSGYDVIINNSIFSDGGTGKGIDSVGASNIECLVLMNNVISGFSGTGGHAVNHDASGGFLGLYGGNHTHNCDSDYDVPTNIPVNLGDNDTNDASAPFSDAANDDFEPQDVASISAGASSGSLPLDSDAWRGT